MGGLVTLPQPASAIVKAGKIQPAEIAGSAQGLSNMSRSKLVRIPSLSDSSGATTNEPCGKLGEQIASNVIPSDLLPNLPSFIRRVCSSLL